jgi:hypothetical protein
VLTVHGQKLVARLPTGRVSANQLVQVSIAIPQATLFSAATGQRIVR